MCSIYLNNNTRQKLSNVKTVRILVKEIWFPCAKYLWDFVNIMQELRDEDNFNRIITKLSLYEHIFLKGIRLGQGCGSEILKLN